MYTIKTEENSTLIIKNSKFISYSFYISCKEDVEKILKKLKTMHPKASHYCYGYIINNLEYCSDDKEPSKTAGVIILNVLKNNLLNNVLVVVVRYFGGIKLGANGLVRSYNKATINVLEKSQKLLLKDGYIISIKTSYEKNNEITYLLKDYEVLSKKYDQLVDIKLKVDDNGLDILKNNNIEYSIIEKTKIKIDEK